MSEHVDDPPERNHEEELNNLVARLVDDPDREAVGSELEALRSIYGEGSIRLWSHNTNISPDPERIRYEVVTSLDPPFEETSLRILVSLPSSYPISSPPQLQLLSKYIGNFGVDSSLFASVLRTFISSTSGVEWKEDEVAVFEGVENVRNRVGIWFSEKVSVEKGKELEREDGRERAIPLGGDEVVQVDVPLPSIPTSLPEGLEIIESEPIVDRKSIFIGRACRITSLSQVDRVIGYLLTDKKIARAAHPVINAWRCEVDGVMHQDNDDDGETAAGSRLAHLLQILELDQILVIVTRYFGGVHLGPDRFKHINQAARNALERGGFLDDQNHVKRARTRITSKRKT